jgi:hypothetical protein
MASWASNNDVTSAPAFVNQMVGAGYANVTTAYANTAYVPGTTAPRLVMVSAATASGKGNQPGWIYSTRGTGGRTGRVNHEVLVTLNSNSAVSGL